MMTRPIAILLAAFALSCSVFSCKGTGSAEPETLTVSPSSVGFSSEDASTKLVYIKATSSWTASTSASWIHIDKDAGSGNASLGVTVEANPGDDREGFISVKGAQDLKITVSQTGGHITGLVARPAAFDGRKRASTTYQLLIYSFADSDGDGVGDFKGIRNKLDYLDALGVTGIWLSPAHPTSSWHAYDVDDYSTVNPRYGTEQDFKNLIDAAHAKGMKIYMDYVLNHSGANNRWFKAAKADPEGEYGSYYVLSGNPVADAAAGKIDNYGGATSPGMGVWHSLGDGTLGYDGRLHFKVDWSRKTVTVTRTDEAAQAPDADASLWLYDGQNKGLHETAPGIFELTLDFSTSWGFLIRTSVSDQWPAGTKYGAKAGRNKITFNEPLSLDNNPDAADIVFGNATSYFASFDKSMPDLDYGPAATASESPAFKALAATADKWIRDFGVDGFRLDAVLWIYQDQVKANQDFLKQWYDRCNATYKAAGHTDELFMVGEAWKEHAVEKLYYKGLPSCFEFDYFGVLSRAVNGSPSSYVSSVMAYIRDHQAQRSDAVTSLFMTNHDQDRAAESFGNDVAKEKQAAAMLLTTPGKPFIYQGEELGYFGKKTGGDEYVRAPIVWDRGAKDCAKTGVNNKVNSALMKGEYSVELQDADGNSLLNVYRTFSRLRNTYPALAEGTMSPAGIAEPSVASWYMTASDGQKLLVMHNVASSSRTVKVSDDISNPVAILGTAASSGDGLILGPHSSIVFLL